MKRLSRLQTRTIPFAPFGRATIPEFTPKYANCLTRKTSPTGPSQFEKAEAAIKNANGTELVQTDAARLLPYGKGYAPAVRGVMPWKGVLKGFGWEQDAHREDTEITAESASEESGADPQPEYLRSGWDPTDWNPEDARVQVWSGDQSYVGQIIELVLRENQIHARFEKADGRNAISVLPGDELRAREIAKEIVEGTPPE